MTGTNQLTDVLLQRPAQPTHETWGSMRGMRALHGQGGVRGASGAAGAGKGPDSFEDAVRRAEADGKNAAKSRSDEAGIAHKNGRKIDGSEHSGGPDGGGGGKTAGTDRGRDTASEAARKPADAADDRTRDTDQKAADGERAAAAARETHRQALSDSAARNAAAAATKDAVGDETSDPQRSAEATSGADTARGSTGAKGGAELDKPAAVIPEEEFPDETGQVPRPAAAAETGHAAQAGRADGGREAGRVTEEWITVGEAGTDPKAVDAAAGEGSRGHGAAAKAHALVEREGKAGDGEETRLVVIDRRATKQTETGRGESRGPSNAHRQNTELHSSVRPDAPDTAHDGRILVFYPANTASGPQGETAARATDLPATFSTTVREMINPKIVKHSSIILKDGERGEIRLNLKPERLGSIRVRVQLEDHRVSGRIIVDNAVVKEALEQNLNELRTAFRAGGFEAGTLEVTVGGREHSEPRGDGTGTGVDGRRVSQLEESVPSAEQSVYEDGAVNLVV